MGKVIRGWDEAFMKMSVGERALIFVPPAMGYGAAGAPPKVPPNATLKFDVTLLRSRGRCRASAADLQATAARSGRRTKYNAVAKQLLGQAPPAETRPKEDARRARADAGDVGDAAVSCAQNHR